MTRATLLAALSLAACSPEPAIETNVPLPPEDASTPRDVFDAAPDAATDAVSDATDAMDVTVTPDVAPDVPCGAAGSACCPGSRCNEGVCAAGRCAIPTGCGAMGDPCCAGSVCTGSLVCASERCAAPVACGGSGAPCCDGSRCGAGLVCASGTCAACGDARQPCCGAACGAGLVCSSGMCAACGMPSQPCCGAACVSGGVCVTGRCAMDGDRDGSPVGSDCDDTDATRFPGARERCNGRDDNCDGAVDEGACGLWFLPRGSLVWQAFPRDAARDADPSRPSPDAPVMPVRAAIDIESAGVVYVLTDATYHVLDLTTRAWTSSGPRERIFPQAMGRALVTGFSVPASHPTPGGTQEGVTLALRDGILSYRFDLRAQTWSYVSADAVPMWTGTFAPNYADVRLSWLDVENVESWVMQSPASFCPAGTTTATRVGPYYGVVAGSAVHISDAGYCWVWVSRTAATAFSPFALVSAPRLDGVAALFYRGGLWAIGG